MGKLQSMERKIAMCLYGKLIKNPKYRANKKNGGIAPVLHDPDFEYIEAGCGKCIECCKQRANGWKVRLAEEIKWNKNECQFVTLTFNEEYLQELTERIKRDEQQGKVKLEKKIEENEIARRAVRLFLERIRKATKKSVRHWLVTELGETNGRIHLHGLMWCERELIEKYWKYGHVFIGTHATEQTINYIIKYITKTDNKHKGFTPKIMTSAGIGKDYIKNGLGKQNEFKGEDTRDYYRDRKGYKTALPYYYRNKIYSEEEKEALWKAKIEKGDRYVCGEKVTDDTIVNIKKYYQEKNKRMGFGDDSEEWSVMYYKLTKKKEKQRKNNKMTDD